ncbi:antitoxin [Mycobacterium avium]|uniref:antitoxin n=1 Tax=Mycobacterium avium TaxID=1764 RepID=UPI001CC54966|nr:antitoxin [Mycobacterium avium]MBZ4521878.1 antitoxin [Mycobacterium avium subsp. hominissuis]MBZ4531261.1 antitoxin [Mycobacterium avium subsp. hominissuis]
MATDTTTIRVPVSTRDRLVAHARQRGISIAALLEEYADQAERKAALEAERVTTLADAEKSEVHDEELDWDDTAGDGVE